MTSPTPAVSTPDPFIGKTVGNCEIIEKINEGGTAFIYRAHNIRFNLDRVIKILKPSLTAEEEFFQRFRQEAQLTARLDHPNILRVFDTGEVNGYFYIEMEQITGQTLRDYISSTPRINERDVLSIASQIAKALEYAHNARITAPTGEEITGILHRDIKPENIMITPGKVVKLMDFGAAKPLNITSQTMQGMIVGTFHYMSPEQLKGDKLDARSDFFSLGIVMYELCTGQKPFTGENLTALIEKITACKYTALREVRAAITPMTGELIDRLLSRNRDHRPPTAREIDETIQVCIQTLSSWSLGRKATVPFSIKRAYPSLSLIISCAALALSIVALCQAPQGTLVRSARGTFGAAGGLTGSTVLDKAKDLESRLQFKEAATLFEMVPSPDRGGLANEYLEAQLRLAHILHTNLKELTRARSILEQLRLEYSDPSIDAYLGGIYFSQALYAEARDRFQAALASKKASAIPFDDEFKGQLLYNNARAIDLQYSYVDKNAALLIEAIKAWQYYIDFADCVKKPGESCQYASRRLSELQKRENQQK